MTFFAKRYHRLAHSHAASAVIEELNAAIANGSILAGLARLGIMAAPILGRFLHIRRSAPDQGALR